MRTSSRARLDLESSLAQALHRGELRLLFQPQIALDTGALVGVEALLRWERPDQGMVSPLDFIPMAEATGLIVPIGAWVLDEACWQAARWRAQFPGRTPLVVSVNVSGRQFNASFVDVVRSAVADARIDPTMLCIEVTESTVMTDVSGGVDMLRQLKDLGIAIAIDDFGTGYSSLAHLGRLPIDIIKIDRSFINGLGTSAPDTAIVGAVVGMAHALDLILVAEGVETDDQSWRLRALGCEHAQGFRFARPIPAEAIDVLMAKEATGALLWEPVAPGHGGLVTDAILIADDDVDVRQLARMALSPAGYGVTEAEAGDEALRVARAEKPEIILLDVHMGATNGLDVCRSLRADPITSECTILMVTASEEASDKVTAFTAGADDYILKPFTPRDLVSRVRSAVQRRREARAS